MNGCLDRCTRDWLSTGFSPRVLRWTRMHHLVAGAVGEGHWPFHSRHVPARLRKASGMSAKVLLHVFHHVGIQHVGRTSLYGRHSAQLCHGGPPSSAAEAEEEDEFYREWKTYLGEQGIDDEKLAAIDQKELDALEGRWRTAMEPDWEFTIVHRTLYFRPCDSPPEAPWVLDMPAASSQASGPSPLPLDETRKNKELYEKTVKDIIEKCALVKPEKKMKGAIWESALEGLKFNYELAYYGGVLLGQEPWYCPYQPSLLSTEEKDRLAMRTESPEWQATLASEPEAEIQKIGEVMHMLGFDQETFPKLSYWDACEDARWQMRAPEGRKRLLLQNRESEYLSWSRPWQ